jgi:hypothetical protein
MKLMVDPVDIRTRQAIEQAKQASERPPSRLAGGGGGDHTGGMDIVRRVEKLEDAVVAIRIDLAEIKGKLSHMPTTWSLVVIVIGIVFTVMGGTLGIVRLLRP